MNIDVNQGQHSQRNIETKAVTANLAIFLFAALSPYLNLNEANEQLDGYNSYHVTLLRPS